MPEVQGLALAAPEDGKLTGAACFVFTDGFQGVPEAAVGAGFDFYEDQFIVGVDSDGVDLAVGAFPFVARGKTPIPVEQPVPVGFEDARGKVFAPAAYGVCLGLAARAGSGAGGFLWGCHGLSFRWRTGAGPFGVAHRAGTCTVPEVRGYSLERQRGLWITHLVRGQMSYPQAFYAISCFKIWSKTLIVKKCDVFMSGPLQAPHTGIKSFGQTPGLPETFKACLSQQILRAFECP